MSPIRPELMSITSRAFEGMTRILFKPFDIKKWFVLGFTAWLAQLMEGGGSGASFNSSGDFGGGGSSGSGGSGGTGTSGTGIDQEQVLEMFRQWIQDNIGMVITIASILMITSVAIFITLVWVRSRGKFMFLDNVVHNRDLVKAPWHEFREQGNSLCRWTLMFVAIGLGILLVIAGFAGWYVIGVVQSQVWSVESTLAVIAVGLVLLLLFLIMGYVYTLLENFVVPIMYRDRVTATEAWRKFLPVLRSAFWWFVLYALWMFVLSIGLAAIVMVVGVMTCCAGFIIMALPYLGVVLLLPAAVFFRVMGIEYLRQFGAEFDVYTSYVPTLPQE